MAIEKISELYFIVKNFFPEQMQFVVPMFLVALAISLYAIIVWNFYRFLAKKDIIQLDLKKYNNSTHPGISKFLAVLFYVIEYLILMPLFVVIWFSVLTTILIVLAKDQLVTNVIIISGAIVVATRITAYYKEDLSKDIAKMFPFTLMTIVILTPGFFDVSTTLSRFSEITSIFSSLFYFAIFIIGIEFVLRFLSIFDRKQEIAEITN